MSVVKVIEILAQSEKGFEDAVQEGVTVASKSVRNISSVYCKDFQVKVENNQVTTYRVTLKISFLVEA
jgi:hypothetical protein